MTADSERKRYEIEIERVLRKTVAVDSDSLPDAMATAYDMADADGWSDLLDNGYRGEGRVIKVTEVNNDQQRTCS